MAPASQGRGVATSESDRSCTLGPLMWTVLCQVPVPKMAGQLGEGQSKREGEEDKSLVSPGAKHHAGCLSQSIKRCSASSKKVVIPPLPRDGRGAQKRGSTPPNAYSLSWVELDWCQVAFWGGLA
jgi:hypothetical protein